MIWFRETDLPVVSVDFHNAFDSISLQIIPVILEAYGVLYMLVKTIMTLYQATKSAVKTTFDLTNTTEKTTGLPRVESLGPFIFILVLDRAPYRQLVRINQILKKRTNIVNIWESDFSNFE